MTTDRAATDAEASDAEVTGLDVTAPDGAGVVARWRAAGERGDAAAAVACLADDVVLVSPLTDRFRFRGREQVGDVLHEAFALIGDIRFHTALVDGPTAALFYRGRLAGHELEEAQLLRLDDEGRIVELTLLLRPLPALTDLMAGLGPALARRRGRRGLAAFLRGATAPLAAMARLGERRIVSLADPERLR